MSKLEIQPILTWLINNNTKFGKTNTNYYDYSAIEFKKTVSVSLI